MRRFVAIHIAGGNPASVTRYLDANRDQLWAEALAEYREGKEAWLPPTLHEHQVTANEVARRTDPILEEALESWLSRAPERFTLKDAAEGVGLVEGSQSATRMPPREQQRLTAALTMAGCKPKRTKAARFWVKGTG